MKVYFAGSIRGGRVDALLYHRLIDHIRKTDRVLTEHVGDLNLQESNRDCEIYTQDTAWLREADLVIAECTCPSLGVGYELAYAERYEKPVHIFYRKDVSLSAMLTGNPFFRIYPYGDESEIYGILDDILKKARADRIRRIQEMEARLNRVTAWLRDGQDTSDVTGDIRALDAYYRGAWRSDFEADEAGELPANLPRGVLSEDALYHVLTEYEEQGKRTNDD